MKKNEYGTHRVIRNEVCLPHPAGKINNNMEDLK